MFIAATVQKHGFTKPHRQINRSLENKTKQPIVQHVLLIVNPKPVRAFLRIGVYSWVDRNKDEVEVSGALQEAIQKLLCFFMVQAQVCTLPTRQLYLGLGAGGMPSSLTLPKKIP